MNLLKLIDITPGKQSHANLNNTTLVSGMNLLFNDYLDYNSPRRPLYVGLSNNRSHSNLGKYKNSNKNQDENH